MASETVDPIDWSHPLPSWAVPPEFHVLYGVNAGTKSQDLLQQPVIVLQCLDRSSMALEILRVRVEDAFQALKNDREMIRRAVGGLMNRSILVLRGTEVMLKDTKG